MRGLASNPLEQLPKSQVVGELARRGTVGSCGVLNLGRGAEGRQALGVEKTMVLYVLFDGVENVCGSVPEWAAAVGVEVWA